MAVNSCLLIEAWRCTYASINWVIIGVGYGLLSAWHQAFADTSADLLPIGLLGTNFWKSLKKNAKIFFQEILNCCHKVTDSKDLEQSCINLFR